ncbi:MAG: helix-turn-helix domain-containing protein, partial [Chloroflexota bacterium]|nr:helix-turn-helix domain-containing protein [Chloroflexota bacterium]
MRKSIKEAIGTTIQDMLDSGFQSSFTKKELNSLGVKIPDIVITSAEIKGIRKKTNLSQSVFAKLLNVSSSSVKQWEQGKRVPTGSTKVLLELLNKSPHLLNYRIDV